MHCAVRINTLLQPEYLKYHRCRVVIWFVLAILASVCVYVKKVPTLAHPTRLWVPSCVYRDVIMDTSYATNGLLIGLPCNWADVIAALDCRVLILLVLLS